MPEADAEAIKAFWLREGALTDVAQVTDRLSQVILHVRDKDGSIAAVCTAYPAILPQTGQPMYHYRCFVGSAWRSSHLMRWMTREAIRRLEDYARLHDYPCVGIAMELENPRFRDALATAPIWHARGVQLVFIGKTVRGLDLRILYFRGAHLKRGNA